MMVKSFLAWMDRAGPLERAQAVDMLARAYLSRALGGDRPEDVEAALTSILDDPAPMVRKALAVVFADRADAPRHIVLSLAADQPQVGALLIARSPILVEPDLVELAFAVEGMSLAAIAMRNDVSQRVSQVVIKRDQRDCALALVRNPEAEIAEDDLVTLARRFGHESAMREAMLARAGLPAVVRYILVTLVAGRLGDFARNGGFIAGSRGQRAIDETLQSAVLTISEKHVAELPHLVRYLRLNAELTPALLLRSVLGGDLAFLTAACAELTDLPLKRIEGLMHSRTDAALGALCRRAELPQFLIRPLIGAIRAAVEEGKGTLTGLSLNVIRAAQSACLDVPGEEGVRLLALLRRYEAEAARHDSRRLADSLRSEARQEFLHFTLQSDQVRLLEELDTEERLGAIRDYQEIAFDPGQVIEVLPLPEEPGLAALDRRLTVIEEADLKAEAHILPPDHWSDLAAVQLANEPVAGAQAEPVEEDLWQLRDVILPETIDRPVAEATKPESRDEGRSTAIDLKTIIAEWRREREARDRALGIAPDAAIAKPEPANDRRLPNSFVVQPRAAFGRKIA
jgi:uncharacterized protein (DUF2336 family)